MQKATTFIALDGTQFSGREECKAYEQKQVAHKLAGLTIDQIHDALNGTDAELASAIEETGARLGRMRVESGGRKRAPKKGSVPEGETTAEAATESSAPRIRAAKRTTRAAA